MKSIEVSYRGRWIRGGGKDFSETIVVPVKSKNNWRITVSCSSVGVSCSPYLISYNDIGVTASHIDFNGSSTLMHFNTHFFKRYKERGKFAMEKPEDLVKYLFKKNPLLIQCYYPREDGTQQLFTPVMGGVGLGNYHVESDICEFKTFVDNSLLGQNQKDQISAIWNQTLRDLTDEIQRRMDKRQRKAQLA